MTKEVEEIIRNKAYYELTADERASVGEYAQNEEEYNNMQWFLTGTTAAFGAAKIEASSGLKKGVMEHLTESKKKKGFWLNSVGVFMLPTNKKFYQKPAFQLGIAAVLIAGLVFTLNPDDKTDKGLAYVDVESEEPIELNETIQPAQSINEDGVLEDLDSDELDEKILGNDQANEQDLMQFEREIAEMEPPMEGQNESTMDLAPAPMIDATDDVGTNSDLMYAAPLVEELSVTDAEEEIALDYYMDDEISEVEEEKSFLEKDAEVMEESLDKKENRRDNAKTTSLRSVAMKKKDTAEEKNLVDAAPGVASADGAVVTSTGNNNASGYAANGEWIKPKALHINKTKELNALFFIEK